MAHEGARTKRRAVRVVGVVEKEGWRKTASDGKGRGSYTPRKRRRRALPAVWYFTDVARFFLLWAAYAYADCYLVSIIKQEIYFIYFIPVRNVSGINSRTTTG
jgi:hypothetical protein